MISYILFLYEVTLNSLNVFQKLVIYKVYTVTQGIKGCLFYKQCCCIGGRGEIYTFSHFTICVDRQLLLMKVWVVKPYALCEANPYNNIVTFRGITLSKNSNNSDIRLEANVFSYKNFHVLTHDFAYIRCSECKLIQDDTKYTSCKQYVTHITKD